MPDRAGVAVLWRSSLARRTALLNLLGLMVLVSGSLALNDIRQGLVDAKVEALAAQAHLMAGVLADAATVGVPEPDLEADRARSVLQRLPIPPSARVRLFDRKGQLIADSDVVNDRIGVQPLAPARERPAKAGKSLAKKSTAAHAERVLSADIQAALQGEEVAAERLNEDSRRVASIAMPIQRVQAVLGVLVIEAGDIDAVIVAERRSLIPFILIAILVTLASSFWLATTVVSPLARLARSADAVRLGHRRLIDRPELLDREDEIGDLTRALTGMTTTLTEQADANARFAADVAHELKNPLASIRSATETLNLTQDESRRARLMQILTSDVARMDRLISETLQASRLDAELARMPLSRIDLSALVQAVLAAYQVSHPGRLTVSGADQPIWVHGLDDALARVLRNLIDNALSFSPSAAPVRVILGRIGKAPKTQITLMIEDDGPGLPLDALDRVFDRFYTQRPVSSAHAGHSGLGLAIVRQIVEACGGRITADNRQSPDGTICGARFTVTLPEARS